MTIEIHTSKDGQFFWRIVATNKHVLCKSETYTRKANAIKTASSIVSHGLAAAVVDMTKDVKPPARKRPRKNVSSRKPK